jgi:hypothetical protein
MKARFRETAAKAARAAAKAGFPAQGVLDIVRRGVTYQDRSEARGELRTLLRAEKRNRVEEWLSLRRPNPPSKQELQNAVEELEAAVREQGVVRTLRKTLWAAIFGGAPVGYPGGPSLF